MLFEFKDKLARSEWDKARWEIKVIIYALAIFQKISTDKTLVVTSVIEQGAHTQGSRHETGHAVDVRTKHLNAEETDEVIIVGRFLAGLFGGRALMEDRRGPREHLHLQI